MVILLPYNDCRREVILEVGWNAASLAQFSPSFKDDYGTLNNNWVLYLRLTSRQWGRESDARYILNWLLLALLGRHHHHTKSHNLNNSHRESFFFQPSFVLFQTKERERTVSNLPWLPVVWGSAEEEKEEACSLLAHTMIEKGAARRRRRRRCLADRARSGFPQR